MAEAAQQSDDWRDIHPAETQTSPYAHGDDWHDIAPPASLDEFAGPKITETPLYKAGEAVQKFGRETFPVSEEERTAHPYASAIGRGVGAMLPAVAATLTAGPAGALAGAAQMGMSAGADTFDDALANGADERTASKAAGIDGAIAMALGSVDLGAVIAPIKRSLPGWSGWAAQKLAQAGRSGLTFMGVGQAQQYLNTEVEKEIYNPGARYSPELKDMLASFVVGAAFGPMHPLHRPGEAPGQPAEVPPLEGEVLPPERGPAPAGLGAREAPIIEGEVVGAPAAEEGRPGGLPPPARALPPPAEAAPAATPQETRAEEQGYVDQAMRNLRTTSRTAAGILDLSSTKGKEEKMVAGLTPQEAARAATANYEGLVRDLYNGRNDLPQDGAGMAQFIDGVAERVNQGIVKPGELQRTADTKFENQTLAADLPLAHRQFSEELAQRLADPNADPVETAAWIEWRSNLMDHFWSDGVGKASKALAAVPLMRAGLPLPFYPPNKDLFAFTSGLPRVDPNDGGEAYLGPRWDGFNALYHDMVYPRESLKAALDRNAPLDELVQHPYVRHVDEQNKKAVPTGTDEDFANPEWRAQRVYDFSAKEFGTAATTEPVRGWDAAVEKLTDRAKLYAGPEGVENGNHAIIILGPPAAGKSGTAEPLARAFRAAIVDADDAKLAIPEYQGGLGTHAVHEESSAMSKDVAVGLLADGANVILPKVGQNETSIRRAMQGLREMGYKVDLVHVAATPEISGRRNIKRMLDTGRLVAPDYIVHVGDKPRETYHLLKGEADDFADINTAVQPRETREASAGLAYAITDGRHIVSGPPAGGGRGEAAPRAEEAQVGQIGPHRVTAADGTAIDVAPRVVEAGHVLTSQDQGYDPALQPRQRSRAASQAQVRDIATNLDPERLGYSAEADRGAPIIGPDGMVESGNGRVLALRRVYDQNGPQAQAYRDWLSRQGVDVSKFRNPILVRQRTTPFTPEQRRAFTVAANQPTTLAMSASERATADARLIDAGSLNLIVNHDDLSRNRDFVRRFVGQLPQTEQGAMTDAHGALSSDGATRIRNAVLAKAYGDAGVLTRIAESTNDEIKSISNALVAAAPRWARMRAGIESGAVRRDVDATPDLIEAVKRTADLRDKGQKLKDYLAQQDAFDRLSDTAEAFMRMFYAPDGGRAASGERIKIALRAYAEEAVKASADKGLDLGLVPVTQRDILKLAQKKEWEGYGRQGRDANRDGTGAGTREPAGGAQAPGPFLTAGSEGFGGEGAEGDQEAAVRAQRPERVIGPSLPGFEPVSSTEVAKRRAGQPLRPRVEQQPVGGDLFGYQGSQQALPLEDFINAVRQEPHGGEVRAGTPPLPTERAPRAPRRATPVGRPDQLSLFGGEGGSGDGGRPSVPVPPQASAGPPTPSEGPSVTKPPDGSAGGGEARPDKPTVIAAVKEAEQKIAQRSRSNYRITDEDHLGEGGLKQKARQNLDAIRILKQIEDENREATPQEKAVLVKYTGWGAMAQQMFARYGDREAWEKERGELRALLNDEEYEAAKASTPNAHYTSPDVIRGMWDAMAHLGFDGGMAIEPSAGIGHFIGLVPDDIAPRTAWTGVELDSITGRIAKALYGGTEMLVQGFEKLKRPSNYYDLAISNVPFGEYHLKEKPYGSHPIHNFFFVKSLDKVRPGGIVSFITSSYTMDAPRHAEFRRLLGRTSDLVGAIRLPGGDAGAFAKNAGTQVTTDIIFLRKKVPGEKPFEGPKWDSLKEIQTLEGPHKINEYYADRPHMMLGEMRLLGSMYRENEPVLIGDATGLREKIAEATKREMQAGAFLSRDTPPPPPIHATEIEPGTKDGAFFVQDGKLYQRREGAGHAHVLPPDDHDRMVRMVDMRDLYNQLVASQLGGAPPEDRNAIRAKLREAYDGFTDKYGPIMKEVRTVTSRLTKEGEPVVLVRHPNFNLFREDPDAFKVASLENYDADTDTAKRAAIQTKDVIRPPVEREIKSPSDALAASLNDVGRIDLNHIARSLGLETQEQAITALGDLVYQNPDGRHWETSDQYLSGNVVKKLNDARAVAAEDDSYKRNVSALEKVQPEPLRGGDITAQLGAPWVPASVYKEFLESVGGEGVAVRQIPITGEWKIDANWWSADARARYGMPSVPDRTTVDPKTVVDAAFNNRQITVKDKVDADKYVTNQKATEEARIKVDLLREAFAGDPEKGIDGWVWQDPERKERLEAIYNPTYNNLVSRQFDGDHLTLPGINPDFAERKHRKDAVWRILQTGNTLLAHAVGGRTDCRRHR